jgi:ABC-type antimicrobial peptide transport system permease subunit
MVMALVRRMRRHSTDKTRKEIDVKYGLAMLLSFMVIVSTSLFVLANPSSSPSSFEKNLEDSLNEIDFYKIMSDVRFFSSLGSRVLGYPGYFKAKQYIIDRFREYGLNVTIQNYKTAMPMEKISWIYVGAPYNLNLTAYALWPNGGLAASVLKGFTGNLYYVGQGDLGDLDGINLTNSILLMDFNSGKNWLKAAELGAKAVIFIEPFGTDRYEALEKGTISPLNFPRLFVNSTAGRLLQKVAEQNIPITIHTEMYWREVEGHNIIGVMEGELKDDVIIISAHFDSWSIVPSVSPSAEESISISTLLELARYFSRHKPLRTIWFVAYSGHWEGGIGPVEFVEHVLLKSTKRVWVQIGIDLSSETWNVDFLHLSPYLASSGIWQDVPSGSFARSPQYNMRFKWIESQVFSLLSGIDVTKLKESASLKISNLTSLVKFNFEVGLSGGIAWGWWGTQTNYYALDTEPSLAINMLAFTIRTQFARRSSWLTPINNFDEIKWSNVIPQIWIVTATSNYFANVPSFDVDWSSIAPARIYVSTNYILGSSILEGKTAEFNPETGWYSPVPKALVRMTIYSSRDEYTWPFIYRYKMSDENGEFRFYGIIPYMQWVFDAWKFDENTGDIVYCLDQGFYGLAQGLTGGITNTAYALTERVTVLLPMFRCVPVTVFGLIDFRRMRRTAITDIRPPYHMFFAESAELRVYDAVSKSLPIFYYTTFGMADGVGIICVKNGTRISIIFNPNVAELSNPFVVLTNSTDDNPEGYGYTVNKPLVLSNTIYLSARDLYLITTGRYEKLARLQVRSLYAEDMIQKAKSFLQNAEKYYDNLSWSKAYINSILALSYIAKAYLYSVMPLYGEASISIVFFALLVFPFSIFLESLLFKQKGVKRFITLLITIILFFITFSAVHPAFTIMSNIQMAIIGVGILLMLIFVSAIFLMELRDLLTSVSISLLGFHIFKTEKVSAILHTIMACVENMRRRRLSVSLIFITITTFAAGLTSLTSTTYTYVISSQERAGEPPITGIVVKSLYGYPPETRGGVLDKPLIDTLKLIAGKDFIVSPRVWLYPPFTYPEGCIIEVVAENGKTAVLRPGVVLGLSSEEAEQVLSDYISSGTATFFGRYEILIPSSLSDKLELKLYDKIYLKGLDRDFTYIGGFTIPMVLSDIDQYYWIPIDPGFEFDLSLIPPIYPPGAQPYPISTENLLIIPWETALKMGGFVSSISLIPVRDISFDEMKNLATLIAENFDVQVYIGYHDRVITLFRLFSYRFLGWETTYILLAISSLSVMNFMMGSILSRKKEIFIYTSLGLSPTGAILMFLTEGIIVSFGGIIFGYLIGFGLNRIFIEMGILPSYFIFNFVSLSIIISMTIILISVLASSVYPSYLATKIITPSLERKWKVRTRPIGDSWEFPLPIRAREDELLAMLNYLREYYMGAGSQKPSFRVNNVLLNLKDKYLLLDLMLTPMEMGISQEVSFRILQMGREYGLTLIITRKTGDRKLWEQRNYPFIDDLRKQLLLWRSLPLREKEKYSVRL